MGGNSSKVIDPVGATIASVTGNKTLNKIQDTLSHIIDPIGYRLENEIKFLGDTAKAVDGFWDNVHIGAHRDTGNMIKGIYTGDWSMFRDSFLSLGTAALYVIGGVAGAMTGQAWLVAAAVVALDGHYNQSQLTSHAVTQVGELEKDIFGSFKLLVFVIPVVFFLEFLQLDGKYLAVFWKISFFAAAVVVVDGILATCSQRSLSSLEINSNKG